MQDGVKTDSTEWSHGAAGKPMIKNIFVWRLLLYSRLSSRPFGFIRLQIEIQAAMKMIQSNSADIYATRLHYSDVIGSARASQIIVLIVCSIVCWGADQRKHQSSASLAFVRGIHRWPLGNVNVTRKMLPFNDVIMECWKLLYITGACRYDDSHVTSDDNVDIMGNVGWSLTVRFTSYFVDASYNCICYGWKNSVEWQ